MLSQVTYTHLNHQSIQPRLWRVGRLMVVLLVMLLMIAGCSQSGDDPESDDEEAVATATPETSEETDPLSDEDIEDLSEIEPDTDDADAPDATEEVRPSNPNEEALIVGDASNVSPDGDYVLSILVEVEDEFSDDIPDTPDGFRWVVLDATLTNFGGETVDVETSSLALVTADGERFEAEEPDAGTQPPLVGGTVAAEESLRGFVRFAVPEEADELIMEWCPIDCETPLTNPLP